MSLVHCAECGELVPVGSYFWRCPTCSVEALSDVAYCDACWIELLQSGLLFDEVYGHPQDVDDLRVDGHGWHLARVGLRVDMATFRGGGAPGDR